MSDLVIILNQRRAIEAFTKGGNLTLGGNLTVAVGPVGRSAHLPSVSFMGFPSFVKHFTGKLLTVDFEAWSVLMLPNQLGVS